MTSDKHMNAVVEKTRYYSLKLGSDYNLSKKLRKNRKDDQLVKHKDIRMYLPLYIPRDHEE